MSKVTCQPGERIRIGGNIEIVVLRTADDAVEMAIHLPVGVAMCKQSPSATGGERSLESFDENSDNDKSPYFVACN